MSNNAGYGEAAGTLAEQRFNLILLTAVWMHLDPHERSSAMDHITGLLLAEGACSSGKDATLLVADLSEPLPFAVGAFDDVVVSLVLHQLEDWATPLAELRRVLRPAGRLLLSVNHPIVYTAVNPGSDYFALARWSDEYAFDGHSTKLTYWHRPLHAMTDAFTDAGFRLSVISEPSISPETPRELLPPHLVDRASFLCFIFFVLKAH
ncbi:MAG: methyltransferase domain-containing protein [Micromonospora sp.]